MSEKFKGYVCGYWPLETKLDPRPEIKEIYKTKTALKRKQKCWKECGIVHVEIVVKGVVKS